MRGGHEDKVASTFMWELSKNTGVRLYPSLLCGGYDDNIFQWKQFRGMEGGEGCGPLCYGENAGLSG